MAGLRLSANILFAQSIREKENSKELSFLSRIIYAVLSRETYPDSRKDKPHNYEWGAARTSILSPISMRGVPDLDFAKIQILFNIQTFVYILMLF